MALKPARLFFLFCILAMAIPSGCDRLKRRGQDPLENLRSVRRQSITKNIPADDVEIISIKEARGAITVHFEPVDEVTVQAVKVLKAPGKKQADKYIGDFSVHTELKGKILSIYTRYPAGFAEKHDARTTYEITAPGGTNIQIESETGAVAVTSGAGNVAVKARSAPVAVSDADGAVSITSESGTVRLLHCFHGADVKTKSASIEFRTEVPPGADTSLQSESGQIDVVLPQDSDVSLQVSAPNQAEAIAGFLDKAQGGGLVLGAGSFALRAKSKSGSVYVIPFRDMK
jgi:hypothetical protein